jgi:hypothetical protein
MATSTVHQNIAVLSGTGSALALLGTGAYFMSFEYEDPSRAQVDHRDIMERQRQRRRKTARRIGIAGALVYVAGLVLLVLSIGLFHDEREAPATSISGMIQQQAQLDSQPTINEPALLSGLATVVLLAGAVQSLRTFKKTETFGWLGPVLYAGGWLANGFAASMQNNSISSLSGTRLAWTLPGAAGIVAGTALLPWQIRNQYASGPALPIAALGYIVYTIGNSAVV